MILWLALALVSLGAVLVDGYTQPGASPNTNALGGTNPVLKIVLPGAAAPGYGGAPPPMKGRGLPPSFEVGDTVLAKASPTVAQAAKKSRSRGLSIFLLILAFVIAIIALAWYLLR
mgnify:CR=1 FL=1